jgi:hypothetical protein
MRCIPPALVPLSAVPAAAQPPAGGAWHCRFESSIDCWTDGCHRAGPPAYFGVMSSTSYHRCTEESCEALPVSKVTIRRESLSAIVPSRGVSVSVEGGKMTENVTEGSRSVTSFGPCSEGPYIVVVTPLR